MSRLCNKVILTVASKIQYKLYKTPFYHIYLTTILCPIIGKNRALKFNNLKILKTHFILPQLNYNCKYDMENIKLAIKFYLLDYIS